MIRLHGKLGENKAIVCVRNRSGNAIWVVTLDEQNPENLNKAKLSCQLA